MTLKKTWRHIWIIQHDSSATQLADTRRMERNRECRNVAIKLIYLTGQIGFKSQQGINPTTWIAMVDKLFFKKEFLNSKKTK